MRNGCDARERLAAKPERPNRAQVLRAGNLAGRVTLDRQSSVVRLHSFPVVLDAEQLLSAQLDRDHDAGRMRIERVLDQFLDDGGWAFDHLAGGDLVGEMKWETMDARHSGNCCLVIAEC